MPINDFEYYRSFAMELFNTINGSINHIKADDILFSSVNVGKYCSYDNGDIMLYTQHICSEYGYYCRYTVKAIIAFTIARELARAELRVDRYKYGDTSYMIGIEDRINRIAYNYLIENYDTIVSKIGNDFDIDHIRGMAKTYNSLKSISTINNIMKHELAISVNFDVF